MDKRSLSERDICTKFITPALGGAGWDLHMQVREEVTFTRGRVIVRGKVVGRGTSSRADYILYHKPNLPLAVIEADDDALALPEDAQALGDRPDHAGPRYRGQRQRRATLARAWETGGNRDRWKPFRGICGLLSDQLQR